MALKKKKSVLAAKLGDKGRKAIVGHAKDETTLGFQKLPRGIKNGRAKVVKVEFSEFKSGDYEGEPYLRAEAIILSPKTFPGFGKLAGQRTSIMIPLCDTQKANGDVTSFDDNMARALNELRKMGGDTEDMESVEELEALAEAIVEEGPTIKFSTSGKEPTKADPDPRVWENWDGLAEEEDEEEEDDEVEDDEEEEESEEEEEEESEEEEEEEAEEEDEEESEDEEEEEESEDEEDEEEEAEEEEEEEDEQEAPEKGDVFNYKPKGAKKAIECEVTAVFASKQTCNLKNLTDGKTMYKSVPWDKLAG